MIRKISLFIILSILVKTGYTQVPWDTIYTVAKNFYEQYKTSLYPDKFSFFFLDEIIAMGDDKNNPDYYVLTTYPRGFVIVANTYKSIPIIGYSFQSKYDKQQFNPAFDWWMKQRSREIKYLKQQALPVHYAWHQYKQPMKHNKVKSVAPLLITQWDQGKYYNSACPPDPNGPDGHCVTGCVATAVSQIMYYHRWPHSGVGCHSYTHPQYGQIAACFDTCFYDFNEMTPVLTNYNRSAALLLYTTGVSFDMLYGPDGSGVWNHSVANSMKAYFKFCQDTRYIFRDSTSLNWDSLVRTNLDARKPLYYAGWEDTTFTMGHAFVCDGYQDTAYYHFNWGWGGYADGYYYSNQLNPAGSNFNIAQELIVDIFPDTNIYVYPLYCSNDTITYNSGTIHTNNGGSKKYLSNSDCTWLIAPSCGKIIQAQFYSFHLASGDTVFIYDGENEQAPLLSFFTQSNPPILVNQTGTTNIKSTTNKLFVRFTSDSFENAYGFHLFYKTQYCSVDTVTAINGTISDGSGICDYQNYTNCRWIIKPQNAQSIKIEFNYFNLATNNTGDFVSIYKNSISSSNLIAQFNGLNQPTQPLYVPSGTAIIRFVTNSAITAGGWELTYEDATIEEFNKSDIQRIYVYPNPVERFTVIKNITVGENVELFDIFGRKIISKTASEEQLYLYELTNKLDKGIFILQVGNEKIKLINLKNL